MIPTTEGFMNEQLSEVGLSESFQAERPAPDRIVFRMTRRI
jgi:hypothetical protein